MPKRTKCSRGFKQQTYPTEIAVHTTESTAFEPVFKIAIQTKEQIYITHYCIIYIQVGGVEWIQRCIPHRSVPCWTRKVLLFACWVCTHELLLSALVSCTTGALGLSSCVWFPWQLSVLYLLPTGQERSQHQSTLFRLISVTMTSWYLGIPDLSKGIFRTTNCTLSVCLLYVAHMIWPQYHKTNA